MEPSSFFSSVLPFSFSLSLSLSAGVGPNVLTQLIRSVPVRREKTMRYRREGRVRLATVRVDGANAKGFVADKRNATADLDSKFPRYTKKKQQKKRNSSGSSRRFYRGRSSADAAVDFGPSHCCKCPLIVYCEICSRDHHNYTDLVSERQRLSVSFPS